jgi:hypothetical protein
MNAPDLGVRRSEGQLTIKVLDFGILESRRGSSELKFEHRPGDGGGPPHVSPGSVGVERGVRVLAGFARRSRRLGSSP